MRLQPTPRRDWLALAAAVLWLLAPLMARAAVAPPPTLQAGAQISYSSWTVEGAAVRLDVMLPRTAAAGLVPLGAPLPDTATVAAAVAANVAADSMGGACEAIDQGEGAGRIYVMAATAALYRFEIIFACPQPSGLVLRDHLFFARFPDHVNYAQVRIDGGRPVLQLFTRDRQSLALPAGNPAPAASLLRFARLGATQLLGQAPPLCLLFGLLLLVRRWRDLGFVPAALGVGYLASLVLALSGFGLSGRGWDGAVTALAILLLGAGALRLRPPGPAVPRGWRIGAATVAVLILIAVIVLAALKGAPVALAIGGLALFGAASIWLAGSDPRWRWLTFAPAALFALADGLGPVGDLAILQPPAAQAAPRLLAYDLGATAAGSLVVAIVVALLWLVARRLASAKRVLAVDMAGAVLVGLGLFWFTTRIYGY